MGLKVCIDSGEDRLSKSSVLKGVSGLYFLALLTNPKIRKRRGTEVVHKILKQKNRAWSFGLKRHRKKNSQSGVGHGGASSAQACGASISAMLPGGLEGDIAY